MHLTWLGNTAVKLQTKNLNEEVTILINPYKPDEGDFPRNLAAQLALFSQGQKGSITLTQDPFVIDTLGEMEVKKVMVYALPAHDQVIFKINSEDLNIVHLGMLNKKPEASILEKIGTPDVLFIPVGGAPYLDIKDAADLVTTMEPRIIIPIAYQSENDPKLKPLDAFLKEVGLKPDITDKKIIIKKKDLPQEETKLMVLEKFV